VPDHQAPPPPARACLLRSYPSSQKGGTLIATDVHDAETHRARLAAGGYRPDECRRCGHDVLHVHDYRSRLTQVVLAKEAIAVVRYCCTNEACEARWQILPAFVARWLWFNWPLVEEACIEPPRERANRPTQRPAPRTVRRWRSRLCSSARAIVVALAASTEDAIGGVLRTLGLDPSRLDLVTVIERPLSAVASLIHQVAPGLRLV
jgi:hypothetical protein